jgi:hypothetical protein
MGGICRQPGCNRRAFMDTDECFDHQLRVGPQVSPQAKLLGCVWFAFVALVSLAVIAGLAWAVYELVTWVTTK